jgi:S1-C subfamily serine protease
MKWHEIVEQVAPSIVKIETPAGHGSGFLCFYNEDKSLCGIATANHVVNHADRWHEPIRIHHFSSGDSVLVREGERVIYTDVPRDSAIILISTVKLKLPQEVIPLIPTDRQLPIGMEVGWLGFPGIDEDALCFFSGTISAWRDFRKAYLIDGVAINGISGGPVIYSDSADKVQIVGTMTAYRANRLTGEVLPGLSVAQDVSHFHDTIASIKSFEEAAKQKQLQDQQQKGASSTPPEAAPSEESTPEGLTNGLI